MNYKAFLLVLLASVVLADWSEPLVLSTEPANAEFPQIYVDPKTKTTHAIWIEDYSKVFKLAYRRIYSNKTYTEVQYLETSRRPRLSNIIGEGNYIYITYDAKRVQGDNNNCDEKDRTGCYEIFFMESRNGGLHWTQPIMISHDTPNDLMDRKGPRIVLVPTHRHIFITYWRSGNMCFTSRNGERAPFSKETAFPYGSTTAYQSIVYTINKRTNQPMLHFFYVNWTGLEENMMYTRSTNLGRSWINPKRIMHYLHDASSDSYFRPFAISNPKIDSESIYIAFIYKNKGHLMWSTNNGDSWSEPLCMNENSPKAIAPRIQLCSNANGKPNMLYALYGVNDKTNNYIFGSMDTKTGQFTQGPQPFKGSNFNWDYMLDCYLENDAINVVAISESDHEDIGKIYLSFNSFKTSGSSSE